MLELRAATNAFYCCSSRNISVGVRGDGVKLSAEMKISSEAQIKLRKSF